MVTVPATVTLPTTVNIPISSAPSVTVGSQAARKPASSARASTPPLAEEPLLQGQRAVGAAGLRRARLPTGAHAAAGRRHRRRAPQRRTAVARRGDRAGQRSCPDLRLDLHVYAANPADRFVFINMRKLREGETLPDGVRVEQITPTGASSPSTASASRSTATSAARRSRRLTLGGQLLDFDRREAVDDPLLHLPRAQRLVEIAARVRSSRAPPTPCVRSRARRAMRASARSSARPMPCARCAGPHEQVFEIQARPADEGREIEEVQRETRRRRRSTRRSARGSPGSAIRARAGNPAGVALASCSSFS